MRTKFLLPQKFKILGWILLSVSILFWILFSIYDHELDWLKANIFVIAGGEFFEKTKYFDFIEVSLTRTIIGIIFIIGALMVAFSKEKIEDEFIAQLRLQSLQWAVLANYILLLFAFVFVYGIEFLTVMLYNMFTVLILFIVRFHYLLLKNQKFAK